MMKYLISILFILTIMSCVVGDKKGNLDTIRLITLDPGHFHAALVQKKMYPRVDSTVHVYAPAGSDLQFHLDRIKGFNTRTADPTAWKEEVYTGNDFFEKMMEEKKGNVVVIAGNNQKKTEYILESLKAGFNVLADKPMVINSEDFAKLKQAFDIAKEKKLLLYDIMTERSEITSIIQRELAMIPEIFGTLQKGTPDIPAVEMIGTHNFYKYVAGNVLTRPSWFMDASQQGEGIVDVTTHLVDLIQWECFPNQSLDTNDIKINTARRWPTNMTLTQFKTITKLDSVPGFLKKSIVNDTALAVYSNGEINYTIRGVHAKVSVQWDYQTASGSDTHYSVMRGTNCTLVIKQGEEQQYKPTLYIQSISDSTTYDMLEKQFNSLFKSKYPDIGIKRVKDGLEILIPDKYKEGHEDHFAKVTQNFLDYFTLGNMPAWEVPNMLTKYYTTTKALEIARKN